MTRLNSRVLQSSLRVAVLPVGILRRARCRHELNRLQSVPLRLDERQFPERVSHPAAVSVHCVQSRG